MQTSSTVTFQWKELECYEENGPITGYRYRVYYNLSYYTEGEVDKNTTMVSLLHNNMEGFSVAAMNTAGMGEHCPTIQVYKFEEGNESVQNVWCMQNMTMPYADEHLLFATGAGYGIESDDNQLVLPGMWNMFKL